MESLERIESLGERAAKVMFELCSTIIGRNWLILVEFGWSYIGLVLELVWILERKRHRFVLIFVLVLKFAIDTASNIGIDIDIEAGKDKDPCIGIETRR